VLTKQHVRERFADLYATGQREPILDKSTDGTTGEPLRLGCSRDVYERRQAMMRRGYAWAGYRVGARALFLWWSPHLRENTLAGRTQARRLDPTRPQRQVPHHRTRAGLTRALAALVQSSQRSSRVHTAPSSTLTGNFATGS
jgi:hypothetical protein